MLIDRFDPNPDFVERHSLEIDAETTAVYEALWRTDFGSSWIAKGLLALRALPKLLLAPKSIAQERAKLREGIDLQSIVDVGFGKLAEEPGREVVLGVLGQFWRPIDNLLPFAREAFAGPVPSGLSRAVWNFVVEEGGQGRTLLQTETRVSCGDRQSRRKFRVYWFLVRPFSGLIRHVMLRAVRRECRALR